MRGRTLLTRASGVLLAAMQIHISDHTLVPSLLAFLRERVHVIADQVGPNEVEVSLLGSMNGAKRRLERRVPHGPRQRAS